jgi:hypothetical protein
MELGRKTVWEGKLIIYLNEATFGKTKAETNRLRGYITEPKISIEKKGIDPYEINNFASFFIDGNYRDIIDFVIEEQKTLLREKNTQIVVH